MARSFIASGSVALRSCKADVVFILGTCTFTLGVLRLRMGLGMR